ncbi:Glycosylphosphatidylinositol (GPI) anchor assembly protein [Metarhizium rileyi]|uniref:Glycosylphosphatidylinositol (GPI) anchor assembly protein n=1 Tax=Metarhizium rileyi (strain RCEF 4871) TaxID=1649241 RepID=A0A5C6G5P1_METRR|nr:Glycosylphosphatidylinositol (GPI) anchor assembly protein [Metarhizium rileyi]
MSSTLVKDTPAQEADSKSQVAPIPLIDSPLSKGIAIVRPVLLLGLLALRFDAVVAEPASSLQLALPAVALIQTAYVTTCLPPAGSQAAKVVRRPRPGEKKRADANGPNTLSCVYFINTAVRLKQTAILALLLTAISTPAVHALFVLFGAPFLGQVSHTLFCSAHFSLLALFPVFYSRGVSGEALTAIAGASAPLDETFGGLVGAVVGAWLGAVPIPLDWDREWQKWPVTVLVGMYAGSLLSSSVSGTFLYGKHLSQFDGENE